jgi:hypothetical protein
MANIAGPVGDEGASELPQRHFRSKWGNPPPSRSAPVYIVAGVRICMPTGLPSPIPTTDLTQSQTTYKQVADLQ